MLPKQRTPDFSNLAAILEKKVPSRPTLFEFFLNNRLYDQLTEEFPGHERFTHEERLTYSFYRAGYDYVILHAGNFRFPYEIAESKKSISLNNSTFTDRAGFDRYRASLMTPDRQDLSGYLRIHEYLPHGMKVIPYGPGGVLENVIALVGYENLCIMIYEDEQLAYDLFEFVGSNLVEHYKRIVRFPWVGAAISNDDWGFNTQTMLSTEDMRRFVFPWHKKIAEVIHDAGKYAILHSCGAYNEVLDDIVNDMGYDARHSYEDNIVPVEQAYEQLQGRLAVLGGIDVNFLITAPEEEVRARCLAMLERTASRGGYALGSGNSIPHYVPDERYFLMTGTVLNA
jgi:uroporphyrinogen decarboxylase